MRHACAASGKEEKRGRPLPRAADVCRSAQPHLSDEISDLAIEVTPPALPHQIKPAQNGLVLQWEHQPAIIPKRIAAPLDEFRPVLESSTAQEAHPSPLARESA